MKRYSNLTTLLISLTAIALVGCESTPEGGSFTLSNGVTVTVDAGTIALALDDRTLWASPAGQFPTARTFSERITGPFAIYTIQRRDEEVITFDRYTGVVQEGDRVSVSFRRRDGEGTLTWIIETGANDNSTRMTLEASGLDVNSLALPIRCDEDGSFHGFGEHYTATDQRGEAFTLMLSEQGIGRVPGEGYGIRQLTGDEHTTWFPMAYYLDARGFGLYMPTTARVEADLCATDATTAWMEVVDNGPLEAIVLHGPTPGNVITQLSAEVGRPAEPPSWAWGLWISSQGGRDIVMADVQSLQDENMPVAAIWSQDWTGVRMNADGGLGVEYRWEADGMHYPELATMISELHDRGIRFLAYANPFIDEALPNHFQEMADANLLITDDSGAPYVFNAPNGRSSHPDFSNEATRDYVRNALMAMVRDYDIDGWMADFGEWTPIDAVNSAGIDGMKFHNEFPIEWHRVNREAMDMTRPDGDWVLFARSGASGVHRYSQIYWIGDQEANWSTHDGLPTVVPALLNLGLSGIPYATHDIAGFSEGPSTKELYQRWTELGAFTPIMRTHEGNDRDNNWNWDSDAETITHFRRFARIHDALRPLFESLSAEAQRTSLPLIRHLLLVFPEDQNVWSISDQYMLGDSLLVAPITTEGATQREVYLPAGTWYDVWTGVSVEGPMTLTVQAPIGSPPVFSRDTDRTDLRAITGDLNASDG